MSDDNNTRKRTFDIFNEDNGDTTQFPTGYINDDNNNNNNNIEGDTDAQNTGLQDTLNEGESSNANIVGDDNAASDLPHKNDDPHNIEASASQNAPREGDPGTGQLQAPLQLHLAGQNVVTNTVAQGTTNTAAQGTEQPQGETQERPAKRPRKSRRRKDEEEPDYSAQVRERLRNNTRTGQACDRCKVCSYTLLTLHFLFLIVYLFPHCHLSSLFFCPDVVWICCFIRSLCLFPSFVLSSCDCRPRVKNAPSFSKDFPII